MTPRHQFLLKISHRRARRPPSGRNRMFHSKCKIICGYTVREDYNTRLNILNIT